MKKIMLILALLIMGGFSLSTVSSAKAMPAPAGIAATTAADSGLQLIGGHRRHGRFRWKHAGFRRGIYLGSGHDFYPRGYYKGFCYDYPYHWWCKKYFFKQY